MILDGYITVDYITIYIYIYIYIYNIYIYIYIYIYIIYIYNMVRIKPMHRIIYILSIYSIKLENSIKAIRLQ